MNSAFTCNLNLVTFYFDNGVAGATFCHSIYKLYHFQWHFLSGFVFSVLVLLKCAPCLSSESKHLLVWLLLAAKTPTFFRSTFAFGSKRVPLELTVLFTRTFARQQPPMERYTMMLKLCFDYVAPVAEKPNLSTLNFAKRAMAETPFTPAYTALAEDGRNVHRIYVRGREWYENISIATDVRSHIDSVYYYEHII